MARAQHLTHSPEGAAITDLILTIFRVNNQLMRAGDRMVRDLELTSGRWQVFGAIEEQPRTVAQIAREYELTRQGILWVVDSMVRDGLVELIVNPEHRRSKLVRMTEKGVARAELVKRRQCTWANTLGERFDARDLESANHMIRRLGKAVKVAGERAEAEPTG